MSSKALIHDDILSEVIYSLNGEKEASYQSMCALSSFIEACIIHDEVLFNPAESICDGGGGLNDFIVNNSFVTTLKREGVLSDFLDRESLDSHLSNIGSDYNSMSFIQDLRWTMNGMISKTSDGEIFANNLKAQILSEFPSIFETSTLLDEDDNPLSEKVSELKQRGLSTEELITLEGWNKNLYAMVNISSLLNLNLYVLPTAIPHQLGAIDYKNTVARRTYNKIIDRLDNPIETEIGDNFFHSKIYPSIAASVIGQAKGDINALPELILEKRLKLTGFRNYLSQFEIEWSLAQSRTVREELEIDLDNAINKIIENYTKEKDRLFYQLWDVVSIPTRILKAIGDKFVKVGRDEYVTSQVKGLKAYWLSRNDAPHNDSAHIAFRKLMPRIASDNAWKSAENLDKEIRNKVK